MSEDAVTTKTPLQRAIDKAGGVKKLAEALDCSPPAIYQWDKVPIERAIQIEKITGITRQELRPDIFGEAA